MDPAGQAGTQEIRALVVHAPKDLGRRVIAAVTNERGVALIKMARALVVAVALAGAACSVPVTPASAVDGGNVQVFQEGPRPPAPVPPNASRVTATVLKHSVWPPGSLQDAMPPVPPDQTLYSLTLEIHTSDRENQELDSLARPGIVIEAFSTKALPSDLVGKKITATLKLAGDTRARRWWISSVPKLP